ncbi:hypothetical protein NW768_007460 [Fusarium equiseti]|uniref:Heterokaryon incompatibility domain-containing protein n=1 Tax=Fusarium equiseti TaxID=61235 RepID=A0ABQ8R889_FUSEQ|nr:hypothetical protein NW768_007460 [Fusarium equiseti]
MDTQRKGLYKKLSPESIRIFHINPQATDISAGTLETVRLDEAPPYYALSHAWGQQAVASDIVLGRNKLTLCNDLAAGILRLREIAADPDTCEPPLDYIWIDNICIDLYNPQERAEQVQLMCTIYSKAVKTLVWLGPAFALSPDAWDLVDNIYRMFRAQHPTTESIDDVPGHIYSDSYHASTGLPGWDQPAWSSFKRLLELRWFSRMWIVQEVALSALDPIIIHGKHLYPWNNLAWCASWLRRKGYARHSQIPQQILNVDAIRILRQSIVKWPLNALMSITQVKFHATDQRDKAYSLLGLASECHESQIPDGLKPDYTISPGQAYCRVTRYLLKRNVSLAFLTRARGTSGSLTRRARLHDLTDLPSWCPDWSDFNQHNKRIRVSLSWIYLSNKSQPATLGFPEHYNASSGKGVEVYDTLDESALKLGGVRVDRIEHALQFNTSCISKEEFAEAFTSIMTRLLAGALPLLAQQTVPEWIENFIKTTTADQHSLHGRSWDQTVKDGSAYLLNLLQLDQNNSGSDLSNHATPELVGALNGSSSGGDPAEYAALVRNFGFNRAFIVTQDGRMGIGPSDSRAGDTVAVIFGGEVTYILRHEKEHFLFVASLQTVGRSTKSPSGFALLSRASPHHLFNRRDVTPAICFDDCNGAFRIAQSVGKSPSLCEQDSSFQKFYAICKECIGNNTEDTSKTEQDYVLPQFEQFIRYCEEDYNTSVILVTAIRTQSYEESTSIILVTSIRTQHATPTPGPCDGCIVTTALDYRSRPIVYTLGTQPATETLTYFPSPVATPSSSPEASDPDVAVIIGPVVPSVVLLLLLGFLFFRWYKRRGMKKAAMGPVADEEEPKEDKAQLHSECIVRPTFELEGSAPTVSKEHNVSLNEESEMPANEPAAHEMSADKRIPRKPVRTRVESVAEES